jgi:peptidoglycan/LPS O-acetylase OafA/YrhL
MSVSQANHFAEYRPDVDGLRAIAILTVVGYHAGLAGARGGFVGVDVFFVISGYLITRMLLSELGAGRTIRLGAFVARRVRRLLPAFFVMTLATLALSVWLLFPQELPRLGKSAIAAALISSNAHFQKFTGGYFDSSTDLMPMLHTWSLSLEEQYYLVWPLLFIGVTWLALRFRQRPAPWIGGALWILLLGSFALNVTTIRTNPSAAFYLMPFRAWEFALGGLLNWFRPQLSVMGRPAAETLFVTGLFAIGASVALLDDQLAYPGWFAAIPTLGATAVIASGSAAAARWPRAVLGAPLMVRIGLLSYSWYLWHWPLLALGRANALGVRSVGRDGAIVLVALALAWVTYRLVESPIRYRRPWIFSGVRGTLALGAAMILGMLVVAGIVVEYGKRRQAEIFQRTGQTAALGFSVRLENCRRERDLNRLEPADACALGPPGVPMTLMVWGDSHGDHLAPMLQAEANHARIRVLSRIQPTCPPLLDAIPYKRSEGLLPCGKYNDMVIDEVGRLTTAGVLRGVILAARWNEYLARQETDPGAMLAWALAERDGRLNASGSGGATVGTPPYDHAGSTTTLARGLRRSVQRLAKQGLRVLIVAPVPELYFHGPQCLYLRSEEQCTISRARVNERRKAALWAIGEAVRGLENVRVWDPVDQFCDGERCYAARNGVVLYTDHNHASPKQARAMWTAASPHLAWLNGK